MVNSITTLSTFSPELSDMPPECRVQSREGVSADELAKIRLWHLQAQSANVMRQTIMADTKAATLLALIGLVATKLAVDLSASNVGMAEVLLFANKAAVLCLCLMVIMPRFPSNRDWEAMLNRERYSWAGLANPKLPDYDHGTFARDADASEMFTSIARANQGAAKVLVYKFKYLRAAFVLAIFDVILTVGYFVGSGMVGEKV